MSRVQPVGRQQQWFYNGWTADHQQSPPHHTPSPLPLQDETPSHVPVDNIGALSIELDNTAEVALASGYVGSVLDWKSGMKVHGFRCHPLPR